MTESADRRLPHETGDPDRELILSSRDGYVWASWPVTAATVRLGRQASVAMIMEDFLAQVALGSKLEKCGSSCHYKD